MPFAKCVRPCEFAYGGCARNGVKVHPKYTKVDGLLRDEQGNYFCHQSRLLTDEDVVCEKCGTDLEPDRDNYEEGILSYRCPSCNHKVKMEV